MHDERLIANVENRTAQEAALAQRSISEIMAEQIVARDRLIEVLRDTLVETKTAWQRAGEPRVPTLLEMEDRINQAILQAPLYRDEFNNAVRERVTFILHDVREGLTNHLMWDAVAPLMNRMDAAGLRALIREQIEKELWLGLGPATTLYIARWHARRDLAVERIMRTILPYIEGRRHNPQREITHIIEDAMT